MPMVTLHKVGEGNLYHIHVLDSHGATDPGFGQGRPGGRPDQGLPGGGGHPDQGLPGSGAHPGNRPPGSGGGGIPDHELPDQPPPNLAPGWTLVLMRGPGGQVGVCRDGPGSPPPRPLPPGGGGQPDQGLPPHPSQGLPGGPPPMPGQGLPGPQPTPTPPMQPGGHAAPRSGSAADCSAALTWLTYLASRRCALRGAPASTTRRTKRVLPTRRTNVRA